MTIKAFKEELHMMDFNGDPWGTTMGAHFAIAEQLHFNHGGCPDEWDYSPGMASEPETNNYWGEILPTETETELLELGDWCYRAVKVLKALGRDY